MKQVIKKIIPKQILKMYHALLPFLGAVIYRFPTKRVKVIGVTGTNGKTTVVHLVTNFLESANYKVASISSLRFKIGSKEWKNTLKMTMPGRMKLQRFLRQAVNARCEYIVMEVTSEGIKQNRHKYINFDTAIFTNLSKEHIESHGSFENYYKTKQKLFKNTKNIHILNSDSPHVDLFSKFKCKKKIFYSLKDWPDFKTSLMGEFNKSNILAAAEAVKNYGVSTETIQKALNRIKSIPGRMEVVIGDPYRVVVDYAHTPNALEKVYKTIKGQMLKVKGEHMICVLGAAGGGRDKWKRPEFAKIASRYCSEIILTDEDPYDENPDQILSEIESGITNYQLPITKILDRREAIKKALQKAEEGDVVIITGKGAEPLMMTKKGPISWDDRKIAREEFAKLHF